MSENDSIQASDETQTEYFHDNFMESACARWREHKAWTYPQMLLSCTGYERLAMMTGKLNQQVTNGGFSQWFENGYGFNPSEVVTAIHVVTPTDTGKLVAEIVADAAKLESEFDHGADYDSDDWFWYDSELNKCNERFYAINEAWLVQREEFFRSASTH